MNTKRITKYVQENNGTSKVIPQNTRYLLKQN